MGIIWLVVEVAHRPEGMSIGCRSRTTPQSRVEAEEGVLGKQKGRRRGKGLKLYTRQTGVEVDDVALRKPRRNKHRVRRSPGRPLSLPPFEVQVDASGKRREKALGHRRGGM